jgi:hypothetical protein
MDTKSVKLVVVSKAFLVPWPSATSAYIEIWNRS